MQAEINGSADRSKRIDWIDFTKGLTLLLVVIGHSVSELEPGSITRGVIFSFHMPIFFILSCYTFRWSANIDEFIRKTKKAARHLLIPAISAYVILIIVAIIRRPALFLSAAFWKGRLYSLIFSSGVQTTFGNVQVPAIGMIWFFVSLFTARTILDFLHLKLDETMLFVISMITGLLGIVTGQIYWLPFSLDISLAIIPFMYFGYKSKNFKFEIHPLRYLLISFAIWACCIFLTFPDWQQRTYFELAIRRYPMFPICYIGAIAGTLFFCALAVICCKLNKAFFPLIYLGRSSLYFFCIHILDSIWNDWYYLEGHQFITAGKRLLFDLLIFAAFMLLRFLFNKIIRKRTS